jgi:hypothetical protein
MRDFLSIERTIRGGPTVRWGRRSPLFTPDAENVPLIRSGGFIVSRSCGDVFPNMCYFGEGEAVLHVRRFGESALFGGGQKDVSAPE